jgi:tetratricopeptide (TPR) repeat protein
MSAQKYEQAIPVWTELSKIAPDDSDGAANLAYSSIVLHRYREVISALEPPLKSNPGQPRLQFQLGSAYLQIGNDEKAIAAFQRAIESDSGLDTLNSEMLNDVAYELSVKKKGLTLALQYSEKAVHQEEEESSKIQVSQLQFQNLAPSNRLASYWDTLGWVHFALGNFPEAEKYLMAAWTASQNADSGDHLGQVFEKLGKKQQAVRYLFACFAGAGKKWKS